jgi:hypothetical protein
MLDSTFLAESFSSVGFRNLIRGFSLACSSLSGAGRLRLYRRQSEIDIAGAKQMGMHDYSEAGRRP